MLPTLGACSFYAAAPTLWNSFPAYISEIGSFGALKKHDKIISLGLLLRSF